MQLTGALLTCEQYYQCSKRNLDEKFQRLVVARIAVCQRINLQFLVERRLKKVHWNIELKKERGKDGIRVKDLGNIEEAVYVCK